MIRFPKRELFIQLGIFIILFMLIFGSRYSRLSNTNAITTDLPVALHLHERIGLDELAEKLDSAAVDFDREELFWAGRVLGWRNFRVGRYEINYNTSYEDFLSNMARGIQDPANVTVLPGNDLSRLSQHLSKQLQADSTAFSEQFSDSSSLGLELGLTGEELLSRMLPNTYQMYWTSNPESVIRRIHREFTSGITERYSTEIEESQFSLDEIIILASIVEWEARHHDEKPKISGLYINRLDRNMRLQADPTVLYALGERRRILYEDYRFDHPYNTYLYSGLPPGPITNPDESSIRAVLMPEQHDYLFMVATPDGSHIFNRTFDEHRKSSNEWREWIQEQYRIKQEQEREEAL
ncbi:MAG: endolytic transglycosylase MltG [Balneolaceae bacterium]